MLQLHELYERLLIGKMSKTKLIAVSGVCSAAALLCIFLANYLSWTAFALGVIASVAVAVPILLDAKNGLYSLLCYIASGVLGVFLGIGNIGFVLPIVVFAIPFALIKTYGESEKILPDGSSKKRMPAWARWVSYYVLCEIALALTFGAMYLFTKSAFERLLENYLIYILAGVVQAALPLYNVVVTGCLKLADSALRKSIKK